MRTPGTILGAPTLLLAIFGVSFVLRAPVTSVPPALADIATDLGLSASLAGAATSLPLVCFGVFAFVAPLLTARAGLEQTMFAVLALVGVGLFVRSAAGTTAFFAGAVLIGSGIAIGNVIGPALLRARFPLRAAVYAGWYTAVLQFSGALGSWLTVPLQVDLGLGWRLALLVWVVPCVAATVAWACVARGGHRRRPVARPSGMGLVARRPLSWAITAFMGGQSLTFYTLLTWIPAQLADVGVSASSAGLLLGLLSILGLFGAILAPRFAVEGHSFAVVLITYGVQATGALLLLLGPLSAIAGVVLCGLTSGAGFALALTFVTDQPDHRDVPAISALSQGVGYLLAAIGPIAFGAIFAATGTWLLPQLLLVAVMALLVVAGGQIGRRLHPADGSGAAS